MEKYYVDVDSEGQQFWYKDPMRTILHRVGAPAIVHPVGAVQWYFNGRRHRADGPAIIGRDCTMQWYFHGCRHRINGPAIEYPDGREAWYIADVKLTDKQVAVIKATLVIEQKTITIDGVDYKLLVS